MFFFALGTETTASFLEWCIYYLVKFPEVQEKMFKEIDEKIGSRSVNLKDKENLPYGRAVIEEITRHNEGQ